MIVSSLPMRRRLSLIKLIFTSILSREKQVRSREIKESREKNWRIGTMTISGLINWKEDEEWRQEIWKSRVRIEEAVTSLLSLDRVVRAFPFFFFFFFFFRTNVKKFKRRILTSDVIFEWSLPANRNSGKRWNLIAEASRCSRNLRR